MAGFTLLFRRTLKLLLLTGCLLLSAGHTEAVVKIMPLGDSLTAGSNGDATYRYWLWKKLVSAGAPVDFVGSQKGVGDGYPRFSDFDQHHEGHSGWTAAQVVPYISTWARTFRPDIVMIDLGSNDIIEGRSAPWVINQLRVIILKLRMVNPRVKVLLAKTPPMIGYEGQIAELNYLIGLLALQLNNANAQVHAVDLAWGYNPATDSGDGFHPNESGEKKIANAFYKRILPLLIILRQPAKYPSRAIQF